MNTKKLISKLKKINTKSEFAGLIEYELTRSINQLLQKGYDIDKQNGVVGIQELSNIADLFDYQYFRDVHYLYWGLKGNWPNIDIIDNLYYKKLREFVQELYDGIN